jgi:hypothetical protein
MRYVHIFLVYKSKKILAIYIVFYALLNLTLRIWRSKNNMQLLFSIWPPNKNVTYLLTYLFTACSRVLFEKLTGFQLVKQFPTFYRTRRFITAFTRARQLETVHTPTSHFLKIHFNIILPPTHGSPKWPLSLRLPHLSPAHASPLPHTRYMPRPSNSSRFLSPEQ